MKKKQIYILFAVIFFVAIAGIVYSYNKKQKEKANTIYTLLERKGVAAQSKEWIEVKKQADDLIKRIKNSKPLADMAVNPLLLTMIATVHRRGSALPGKRVELYKEICQVLLERRQRAKNIADALTATQKQSVLQVLAFELMQQKTREFNLSDGMPIPVSVTLNIIVL